MRFKLTSSDEDVEHEQHLGDNTTMESDDDDDDGDTGAENMDAFEADGFIVDDDLDNEDESSKPKQKRRKRKSLKDLLDNDYELVEEEIFGLLSGSQSLKRCKSGKKANIRGDKEVIDAGENILPQAKKMKGVQGQVAGLKSNLLVSDQCKGVASTSFGQYVGEDEDGEVLANLMEDRHATKKGKYAAIRRTTHAKGKMPRKGTGNSTTAQKEAGKLFRDVSQLFRGCDGHNFQAEKIEDQELEEESVRCHQKFHVLSQRELENEFEPTVLEERYLTEKDYLICQADMPERLQLWIEKFGESTQCLRAREAEWIYETVFGHLAAPMPVEFGQIAKLERAQVVEQITNVLELLHDQKVEIPFIAMYRKEMCLHLLMDSDANSVEMENIEERSTLRYYKALWAVWHSDRKWQLLQWRRANLSAAYASLKLADKHTDQHELLQQIIETLDSAQSEQEVDDVEKKFRLYFSPDDVEAGEGQYKRPKLITQYSKFYKAGYRLISKHFGLSPKHFGENLQAMSKIHMVTDSTLTPEEISAEFPDPKLALECAREMAALEISVEPTVCDYSRKIYAESGTVTTRPTSEGHKIIDSFHPCAGVKFLENNPLDDFADGRWLLIQNAEEEKLLEVTIGLDEEFIRSRLMQEVMPFYLSKGVNQNAELWNEQRRQILHDSVTNLILPNLEKETRLSLSRKAKQSILTHCGNCLWKLVSAAPYSNPLENLEFDGPKKEGHRVMACCWGPGKPATTFVMLDSSGNLTDILHTGYLSFLASSPEQQQRKQKDQQQLLQFLQSNHPDVIVLGAANLSCRHLKADIDEVVYMLRDSISHSGEMGTLPIVYGDEVIPRLYEHSHAAEEQLQQQPGIVRRAVALGRYLQNPLALVSSLFGPSRDILSLKLHISQNSLVPEELYEMLECVMITVTNQVGLDVNVALSHEWLLAPLQFISGLGPRKSAYFTQALKSTESLDSRQDLLKSLGLMKQNIFLNVSGFMCVRRIGQPSNVNEGSINILDDTRIHPESYELAIRMAEDACCQDPVNNSEELEADSIKIPVLHIRKNPHKLQNLDIESYATTVEARGFGKKLATLRDIKLELQHGFQDWRLQYAEPTENENFWLLTGENEDSLAVGKHIKATVRKVQERQVLCVLECGLLGKFNKGNIEMQALDMEHISEGSIIECMVKEIDKEKYLVELTVCPQESSIEHKKLDTASYDASLMCIGQEEARKTNEDNKSKFESEKPKCFQQRTIIHHCFQNMSLAEVREELSKRDAGSLLFHPSTRGPSYLSMTLKLYDEIYMHTEILERGKDIHDLASFSRLGNLLIIGGKTFEHLDQVIDQYVNPLMSHWREMLQHRKFMSGTKAEVDELICKEKRDNPLCIPYHFTICYEHPGAFTLAYARSISANLHHEYISMSPSGFRFRKVLFETPDKIVNYFQKHFNDPILPLPIFPERKMEFGRARFRGRGRRGRGGEGQGFSDHNLSGSQEGQENSESAQWNEGRNWNSEDQSGRGCGWRENDRGRRGSGRRGGRGWNRGDCNQSDGWDGAATTTAETSDRGESDWDSGWNTKVTGENDDGWNKLNEEGSDAGGWGGSTQPTDNKWGESQNMSVKHLEENGRNSGSWQWDKVEDWRDKNQADSGHEFRQTGRGRGSERRGRWDWKQGRGRAQEELSEGCVFKQEGNRWNGDSTTGRGRRGSGRRGGRGWNCNESDRWDGAGTTTAEPSVRGQSDWDSGWNAKVTGENDDGWNKCNEGGSGAGGWEGIRQPTDSKWGQSEIISNKNLEERGGNSGSCEWDSTKVIGETEGDWNRPNEGSDAGGWGGSRQPTDNKWGNSENTSIKNLEERGGNSGSWQCDNAKVTGENDGGWNKPNKEGSDAGGWGGSGQPTDNKWGQSQNISNKNLEEWGGNSGSCQWDNTKATGENDDGWNKPNEEGSDAGGWGGSRQPTDNRWGHSENIFNKNLEERGGKSGSWQWNKAENWRDKNQAHSGHEFRQTGRGRGSERRERWDWKQGRGRAQEELPEGCVFKQEGNRWNGDSTTGRGRRGSGRRGGRGWNRGDCNESDGWDGAATSTGEPSGRGESDWDGGWNTKVTGENDDGWNKFNKEGSNATGWGGSRQLTDNKWGQSESISDKNIEERGGNSGSCQWDNTKVFGENYDGWNKPNEECSDAGGWGGSREPSDNKWGQSENMSNKNLEQRGENSGSCQWDNTKVTGENDGGWNKPNEAGSDAGVWGGSTQPTNISEKYLEERGGNSGSWQWDNVEDWPDKNQAHSGHKFRQTGRGRGSDRSGRWDWKQGRGRAQEEGNRWNGDSTTGRGRRGSGRRGQRVKGQGWKVWIESRLGGSRPFRKWMGADY
ncbi:hypothetical protein O6H91_05G078100 [Diphasiastrum complanatum]|uniref:Uncharacterized protein n=4 Tax=Diphasiastrum complanatum TaxID=34168 RepID=A0ACC2DQQ3_DIPCM|nr:hypothetical protein O6H91_05G078100 [Diphasiastrum complanatum]